MACSMYFHNMGSLLLQQRLDISNCPSSTLGTCNPAPTRHLVTSTPHKRAGSLCSCDSCVNSNTFCCHCCREEESIAISSSFVPAFLIHHTDGQSEEKKVRRMRSRTPQNINMGTRKPKGLKGSDGFLGLSQHLRGWKVPALIGKYGQTKWELKEAPSRAKGMCFVHTSISIGLVFLDICRLF